MSALKKCSGRACTFARDRLWWWVAHRKVEWQHRLFNVRQAVFDVVCFCICASTQHHFAPATTLEHQTIIFKADGRIIQSQDEFWQKEILTRIFYPSGQMRFDWLVNAQVAIGGRVPKKPRGCNHNHIPKELDTN